MKNPPTNTKRLFKDRQTERGNEASLKLSFNLKKFIFDVEELTVVELALSSLESLHEFFQPTQANRLSRYLQTANAPSFQYQSVFS